MTNTNTEATQPVETATEGQHVECRQCARCNHAGINDSSEQLAVCLSCEWSGNSPDEDRCPECDKTGCMGVACPKCGARYTLIAEAELKVSATEAPEIDEAKLRKVLRQARIQQLYVFEKSEIDSLVLELCGTSVAKVGIDACTWAGDGEGNWHTACGNTFTLMEGSPADNNMRRCPYCGRNLRATGADVCGAVIGASHKGGYGDAQDAARYRWLRDHYDPSFHDSECDSLIGLKGYDLDAAIDAELEAASVKVGVSTFKIGDRVRIIDTDYDTSEDANLSNGQTGYIIKILDGGVTIQTDAGPRNRNGKDGWCFFDEQLELIPNEQQPTSNEAGVSDE